MRVDALFHPSLTFSDEELPLEGATHTRPLQITIKCRGAKVLMVLIDNRSALNVCPFRIALTIGLDVETIIPFPLTVRAHDNTSRCERPDLFGFSQSKEKGIDTSVDTTFCMPYDLSPRSPMMLKF